MYQQKKQANLLIHLTTLLNLNPFYKIRRTITKRCRSFSPPRQRLDWLLHLDAGFRRSILNAAQLWRNVERLRCLHWHSAPQLLFCRWLVLLLMLLLIFLLLLVLPNATPRLQRLRRTRPPLSTTGARRLAARPHRARRPMRATLAGHIADVRRQAGHATRSPILVQLDLDVAPLRIRAHRGQTLQLLPVAAARQEHHDGVGDLQRAPHQIAGARLHHALHVEDALRRVLGSAPWRTHEDDVGAHVEIVGEKIPDAKLNAVLDAVDPRVVARHLDLPRIDIDGDHFAAGARKLDGVAAAPAKGVHDCAARQALGGRSRQPLGRHAEPALLIELAAAVVQREQIESVLPVLAHLGPVVADELGR